MSDLVGFAAARRQSRASLLGTWLDGGVINIYSGTRPATADTAITTQTLLCSIALDDPSGGAAGGVWTADPLPDPGMVLADGTAAWARLRDADDAAVCDLDVGVTGSGAALELSNLSLVSGAMVTPTSLTITEG
jgi:hypothetical protein